MCRGGGGGKSIWGVGEKIRKITAGNIVSSGMAEYWGNRGGRLYVAMSHCNGRQAKEAQDNCPKESLKIKDDLHDTGWFWRAV